mgnify:FL=1
MRRADREIVDFDEIVGIVDKCYCCRLGFCDNGSAYIVPLNFGYKAEDKSLTFYFHSAREGRKIGLLASSPLVGFELDTGFELNTGSAACGYSAKFQSVIGSGTAEIVEDLQEKKLGLKLLMKHYTGRGDWDFSDRDCGSVAVIRLKVREMTCKRHD